MSHLLVKHVKHVKQSHLIHLPWIISWRVPSRGESRLHEWDHVMASWCGKHLAYRPRKKKWRDQCSKQIYWQATSMQPGQQIRTGPPSGLLAAETCEQKHGIKKRNHGDTHTWLNLETRKDGNIKQSDGYIIKSWGHKQEADQSWSIKNISAVVEMVQGSKNGWSLFLFD